MNQIAIGDPIKGFIVLDGQSVAVPNVKAIIHFKFSSEPYVQEVIDCQYKGTSSQITGAIAKLELIIQRALLYENVAYASPQYLRFQLTAGGDYFYTPITNIYLAANPDGYLTITTGSKVISLHYTRPNYFDGPKTQLPLTGRAGTYNPPNTYPLVNHTDSGTGHGSTVLIDKNDFSTDLPAPIRFEYFFNNAGAANLKYLYTGIFNHTSYDGDLPFFAYYNSLNGGSAYANSGAIQGYYDRFTWLSSNWASITWYLIDPTFAGYFDGHTFRPIIHLFNTHAYTDLYLRVQIERYGDVLYISEPVYAEPGQGYIILPPIELPPNYLLREVAPATLQVCIYGLRISGVGTTLDIDCLTIFPLSYAATFNGFINMTYEQTLIDDSFRGRHNILTGFTSGESVAHARVGGPLMLFPNAYSRIFFYCANSTNLMPITYLADLKVFYYPRLRLL
jgi:hypothetical protein